MAPRCDAATFEWHCPADAWLYQRAASTGSSAECLPLHDEALQIESLSGSLSRVPTDDGRCIWIAEQLQPASGETLYNVGFEPDPHAPFGACPSAVKFLGTSGPATMVRFSDGSEVDPDIEQVQITGGFSQGGSTRVSYRLFRVDSNAVFGLTELGTGLGDWDASSEHILVREQPRFATDLDFGNASWVEGGYAYLWGCNAPGHYLTEGCLLARREAYDRVDVYLGAQQWGAPTPGHGGAIVFDDGPWISAVERNPSASSDLLHVFASAFTDHLQVQHASLPEGPWASAAPLAPCRLPAADEKSYCAGPVLHQELADPTRPNELVVSYGVASTGTGTGARLDYWSRLAWLSQ